MTTPFPALFISIPDGVIDLGWGHPSPRLHPLAALQQATAHMFASTGVQALQYGAEQGFGPLLESLAAFLARQEAYAMHVDPTTLFLTNGASPALDLTCTLLTHPGETVFVEEPTYYLVQRIFADHHLRVVGIPTDEQGLCTEALAATLRATYGERVQALATALRQHLHSQVRFATPTGGYFVWVTCTDDVNTPACCPTRSRLAYRTVQAQPSRPPGRVRKHYA